VDCGPGVVHNRRIPGARRIIELIEPALFVIVALPAVALSLNVRVVLLMICALAAVALVPKEVIPVPVFEIVALAAVAEKRNASDPLVLVMVEFAAVAKRSYVISPLLTITVLLDGRAAGKRNMPVVV